MLVDVFEQVLALFWFVSPPQLFDDLLVTVDLVVQSLVLLDAGAAVDRLAAVTVQVLAAVFLIVDFARVGVVGDEGVAVGPTGLRGHRLPQEIV